MKSRIFRGLSVTALLLGLAISATACTGAEPESNQSGGQKAPEQTIGSTVNSIRDAIRDIEGMSEEQAVEAEARIGSYFDPAMEQGEKEDVVTIFAEVIAEDPDATIEVDPSKIQTEGDTAKLHGKDIKVTINGEVMDGGESGGVITMKRQGGKWLISDLETPDSGPSTQDPSGAEDGSINE